ncbi:FAD-dependent oxidoreductase [Sphingosinicella sp. BN140058]|uniref:FAD-dependent oxidoreductase n=1 Tax=Sphingosinicella sp. BN140058 TaxID=1892855 RepID=UPI0010111F27|nr:FAD-dependent oxidoreductase [Sphingosinicella sp. BN140058]QAY77860.1 hypothetical protein ETR14_16030 [Sphingosinicella sp. BN140058]
MTRRIERVLVVGRDAAAWIAALAVQRSLGPAGVRVQLLELPSVLRSVDAYPTLPAFLALNRLLGIGEAELLSACAAAPVIGQRFSNWARARGGFVLGYDTPVPTGAEVGFLQYWLKARSEGLRVELEDFSLAAAAAKQGRIPSAGAGEGGLSAAPGYNVDALRYVELLRRRALASGVDVRSEPVAQIRRDGERIDAVTLRGGEQLQADLYVDASGVQGALIGPPEEGEFSSWSQWLPCDRLLAASGPRLPELPAFSEISAFKAGWIGLYPLQDRTAVIACYASGAMEDAEMVERLPILAGIAIDGDAFVTSLQPGMRDRPWRGNCVAIGDAAASLEPLDAISLHLIHIGVSHLVALFPANAERMPEALVYNRVVASHVANLRDFQAAHFKLNRRDGEPFWDHVRVAPGPGALDERIRLFASRGLVALREDETFQEQSWSGMLVGHGVVPAGWDPRVDLVPQEQHLQRIQQRLRDIAAQVRAMPSAAAYVAATLSSRG